MQALAADGFDVPELVPTSAGKLFEVVSHREIPEPRQVDLFAWIDGQPLGSVPAVYELAIYCDFPQPPQLELRTDAATFEKKLAGIEAYRSQLQIAQLVDNMRKAGPFEYLREMNFRFYSPENHKRAFA